ncbi:MAG: site-specific DNA-methyltransferase [Blastocatellia bacterium]
MIVPPRQKEAMPPRKRTPDNNAAQSGVTDYRHTSAKRRNNPPARLAAENPVPMMAKIEYAYSPHRVPALQFDPDGGPDAVQKLLAEARERTLTDDEVKTLTAALQAQEPWLEWAGKREQRTLQVDPVALHIHERVSAQAILKVAAREDAQRELFADPQQAYHEAVQFYQHDVDWSNRLILGDSLQVMASLAAREDLAGKVQMIYFDPPYGIKFASNFQPEIGKRDVKDKEQDLTREPEMVKAYRDTWNLGIHSYLSYLRDRLVAAKELLADTGSIFVQISDENLHRVRGLLDEVFGSENSCATIAFSKTSSQTSELIPATADYLLWYARSKEVVKFKPIFVDKTVGVEGAASYNFVEVNSVRRPLSSEEKKGGTLPIGGKKFRVSDLTSQRQGRASGPGSAMYYEVSFAGTVFKPSNQRGWTTTKEGMSRLAKADRLFAREGSLGYLRYLDDYPVFPLSNTWVDTSAGYNTERLYVVQTMERVIQRCLLMTTDPGDLVLDPTCGSGTTAYVAEQWGRRWMTIDTSRVALAIARQRLLTAKFEAYRLLGGGVRQTARPQALSTRPCRTSRSNPSRKTPTSTRSSLGMSRFSMRSSRPATRRSLA